MNVINGYEALDHVDVLFETVWRNKSIEDNVDVLFWTVCRNRSKEDNTDILF
jgi:hypothetical protein